MTDRKHDLKKALEANRARRIAPAWLARLREILGYVVGPESLIAVPETLRLTDAFTDKIIAVAEDGTGRARTEGLRMIWSGQLVDQVPGVMARLARQSSDERVAMLSSVSDVIGAVEIPCRHAMKHASDLHRLAEMDLQIMQRDMKAGLYFDRDLVGKVERCELIVWGEWANALRF